MYWKNWRLRTGLAATFVVSLFAANVFAAPIDLNLVGNTQFDQWTQLNNINNPGISSYPGSAPWTGPIVSDDGDSSFIKVSGAAYPGTSPTSGVYSSGMSLTPNTIGGGFTVTDSTPLANLATVAFQIEISEVFGYDFYNDAMPTLSYNGGSQALVAGESLLLSQVPGAVFGGDPSFNNSYLFGWDLSSITNPITSFVVSFTGVQHSSIYSMQLDQSDVVQTAATPEPGTLAILLGALPAAAFYLRRRFASISSVA
ncbi:hypothetical protein DSM3645_28192 [Blastopirellula marina DSM 3645]|uniref:PEP-CTERM protein-sorting domain-containing protein n=2 Tax=Blastopirellula marina TaxID=124 RepID=A3ZP64_9BACT|nr:hypothetical protein DSM3645_28192 [Blastopirellula marina DSM 3645]